MQYIVKSINEQRTSIPVSLKIHLKVEENTIIFTCLCLQVNLLEDKGLERIRQRLNLLYGNRYRLFLTTESIWLELKGGEVWTWIQNIEELEDKSVTAFLLSPHYRTCRHLLLQIIVLLMTINVFWYEPLQSVSFWRRFGGFLAYFVSINTVIYMNLYILVPCFSVEEPVWGTMSWRLSWRIW